jgi:glutamate-5-semialdehyde dehydrogenase
MDAASKFDLSVILHQARRAASTLAIAPNQTRNQAIHQLWVLLRSRQNDLLESNTLDLETSRETAVPSLVLHWLKLTPERLTSLGIILEQLIHLPDPLASNTAHLLALPLTQSYAQAVPRGTVGLIYEAFPELAILLAAMCWKTGNGLLLRGGTAANYSNQLILELLQTALSGAELPPACVQLLPGDRILTVKEVVSQPDGLDLVIPYGRPSLIQQVTQQATVPVVSPAMGNCYLFWSEFCSGDMVRSMILESHEGRPDAVNAIEKVLLTPNIKPARLTLLWNALQEHGFEVRGDAEMVATFPDLILAAKEEWQQPYLQKVVAFKMVKDFRAAIAWINSYSSGHADCLVTDSYAESRQFALEVTSALTYINASPRFSRQSSGPQGTVALGICGQRSSYPGIISLNTLLQSKQIIQGNSGPTKPTSIP